jgi:hypothetical protein
MDERSEPSVWYVASLAICAVIGFMVLTSVFGGADTAVALAAK